MNQFVDAAVILATNPHVVGFLIAEKSLHKPVIGQLAKVAGCIPVIRPQDTAKKGVGLVMFEGNFLIGKDGTTFTALKSGDKVRPGKTPDGYVSSLSYY
jgi:glycerol-3-phosphate O-acyltransferase/dihydroxyacetone phosphate acyltransferase